MKNRTVHVNRFAVVALVGVVLAFGILLTSCGSKAPSSQTPPAQPSKDRTAGKVTTKPPAKVIPETKTPAAPAPAAAKSAETDTLAAIEASADPFALYAIQQKVAQQPDMLKAIQAALDKKWLEFETSKPPQTLIEGLQCVAFKMVPAGENKCEFSVLLKSTGNIQADYQVTLIGRVDPAHESFLSETARKMKDREIWCLREWNPKKSEWAVPDDMTTWQPGEYHLVSRTLSCSPIPYNVSVVLSIWDSGRWKSNEGNIVKLGWHAALDDK